MAARDSDTAKGVQGMRAAVMVVVVVVALMMARSLLLRLQVWVRARKIFGPNETCSGADRSGGVRRCWGLGKWILHLEKWRRAHAAYHGRGESCPGEADHEVRHAQSAVQFC